MKPVHPLFPELSPEGGFLLSFSHPAPNPDWFQAHSTLLPEAPQWPGILAAADGHGVVPLLFRNLKTGFSGHLPQQAAAELWSRNRSLVHRNLLLTGALVGVVRTFQKEGVPLLVFKGPLLAQVLYGDLGMRQYGDLDILIPRARLEDALLILDSLGYRPHIDRSFRCREAAHRFLYEEELVHETRAIRIDLHWHLTASYTRLSAFVRDPFRTAASQGFQGIDVPCLPPVERLIYLCQHGSKHGWQRLIWIADVARAAQLLPEAAWPSLLEHARNSGGNRMLMLGLYLASQLWDIRFPERVHLSMQSDPAIAPLARHVCRYLLAGNGGAAAVGLNRKMFYCRTLESGRDKATFLLGRAFTPNEPDWQWFSLPRPLFFLYFPLRILRLAGAFAAVKIRHFFQRAPS